MLFQGQTNKLYAQRDVAFSDETETRAYNFGRAVVRAASSLIMRLDVEKHAPLPAGPKIIAANHPSTSDPGLMMLLCDDPVHILIHETLFKVPHFGKYLRRSGHIPVVHGQGKLAVNEALERLADGQTIGIFTEGSLSPFEGGFMKPRTGTVRLALGAGVPIIPVGIHLDRERLHLIETEVEGRTEVGRWYLHGPYAMTVGAPLQLRGDVNDRSLVRALSQQVMDSIIRLSHESAARHAKRAARKQQRSWFAPFSSPEMGG